MEELKLHDIKPLLEINDYSFFIFITFIIILIVASALIFIFLYKFIKNKKPNLKKDYLNILKNLDFSNSKKIAYDVTKYGRLLVKNDRERKILEELIEKLEKYKYKKNIDSIDENTKAMILNFVDVIDDK